MTTRKDNDQDPRIVMLRVMFENVMNSMKQYWHSKEVYSWRYEIREEIVDKDYVLTVLCGDRSKAPLATVLKYISPLNDNDMGLRTLERLRTWNRLYLDVMQMGVARLYQNTIEMYRSGEIDNNGISYEDHPLYPNE